MTFEDWFHETEVFSLRCERFHDDIVNMSSRPYKTQYDVMVKWLEAAYEVGKEHGKS